MTGKKQKKPAGSAHRMAHWGRSSNEVTPVNIFHLIKYASMKVIFQHSGVVFACIMTDWCELW